MQHLLSANSKSSLVVVRSADSTTLDFFVSAIVKSFFTTGLSCRLERSAYEIFDFDVMLCRANGLEPRRVGINKPSARFFMLLMQ